MYYLLVPLSIQNVTNFLTDMVYASAPFVFHGLVNSEFWISQIAKIILQTESFDLLFLLRNMVC